MKEDFAKGDPVEVRLRDGDIEEWHPATIIGSYPMHVVVMIEGWGVAVHRKHVRRADQT